jgi:D-glucuronyl C5-epimerase C-terminus
LSHRAIFGWLAAAALWGLGNPALTQAAQVVVLGPEGHVVVRDDPWIRRQALTAPPGIPARAEPSRPRAETADRNVRTELARLFHSHQIDRVRYVRYRTSFDGALRTVKRLRGTRAVALEAVIENVHGIAATGLLTPSRLPALFLTLDRNRSWWSSGPLLSSGQRVQFAGSQIVWEYYPGQGIELQELGSWGQADWMYQAGPRYWRRLRRLVDELIPLAARRGGGLAWEYYFSFDGGAPPWTSAMSQGTAVQALTQAYEVSHDRTYLDLARRALPIFGDEQPVGVSVRTRRGLRYLLYSFAPDRSVAVINGFLQALIGLYDYAKVSGDPTGVRLFRSGDVEARAELPSYDTGSWSLYQPGVKDTLDYHMLVTGFLEQLCSRTHERAYCRTSARFERYLKHPPV